jgi:WD40 repeat protein
MDDSEMAFSPDSKLLAIGGGEACEDCGVDDKHPAKPRPEDLDPDNSVKIFDVSTGKKIKVLAGHVKSVDAIAFAPNGQILATGDNNGSIRLWNVSTWNELRKFGNRDDQLEVVVFSPDNRLLAAGTFDGLIRLWDVTTGRQLRMLSGHTYSILDLAFTPDGKQLLSVDSSAKLLVKRWDVDSGQEIPLQPAAAQ